MVETSQHGPHDMHGILDPGTTTRTDLCDELQRRRARLVCSRAVPDEARDLGLMPKRDDHASRIAGILPMTEVALGQPAGGPVLAFQHGHLGQMHQRIPGEGWGAF
jgi:hypothetical protein